MKRIALLLALLGTPAAAENVKLYVVQPGGGIVVRPGNVTVAGAAAALDAGAPPEGATALVIQKNRVPVWTSLPAGEVHRDKGGTGEPVTELLPQGGDGEPPIEVFPDDGSGIAPRAGAWTGRMVSQDVSAGCPEGTAEAAAAQFAAMDGTQVQGRIDASFAPSAIFPQFGWTRTGPNAWSGTLKMGGGPGAAVVSMDIEIASADLIRVDQRFAIGGCVSNARVNLVREG